MMLIKTKNQDKCIFNCNIPEYNEADYVVQTDTGIWAIFNVYLEKNGKFTADVFFSEFKGADDYQEEIKLKADDMPSDIWNLIHNKIEEEIHHFTDISKDSFTSSWLEGYRDAMTKKWL